MAFDERNGMSLHPVTQLRLYDERFKDNARGLPGAQIDIGVVWRAIGFRIGNVLLAASMDQRSSETTCRMPATAD